MDSPLPLPLHLLLFLFHLPLSSSSTSLIDFPSPRVNYSQCHMRSSSRVCDVDEVLPESDRYRINSKLINLQSQSERGGNNFCARKGIEADFVAVRQGDQELANGLYDKWRVDPQCGKAVLILFSKTDNRLYLAGTSRAGINDSQSSSILSSALPLLGSSPVPAVESLLSSLSKAAPGPPIQSGVPLPRPGERPPAPSQSSSALLPLLLPLLPPLLALTFL